MHAGSMPAVAFANSGRSKIERVGLIMMTLEEAKEYTRKTLKQYYTDEEIEKVVNGYISVVRPGVVLAESNAGKIEIYL